ncbi:hypothetical protein CAPTEDRAFT_198447 [Capitella teleta]|uniref:Uncharacterized protein n=1 Tax=Capitella teleta TaxID=283909 RepID=R7TWG1_CAPTE|nr:hypothetical protein CAPTEDRAFT_198447 [Capitella teleta]|eukprot:ELT97927.1 hypothetical protein CAPTEDRAFT_198447 [Capitella teleta]
MANARKSSVRGQKDDVPLLKMKISELEEQVADYKKRIEDLRKAKNTTLIKREREIIDVRAPNLGQRETCLKSLITAPLFLDYADVQTYTIGDVQEQNEQQELDPSASDGRVADLEKQLKEMEAKHLKEKDELMKKNQERAMKNDTKQECGHEAEIAQLKRSLEDAQSDVTVLRIENQDLRERVEALIMDLSIKEAKWCETEDLLSNKLKLEWGEKYREWMQETERKIVELQEANTLLRGYLDRGAGSSS